MLYKWAIEIFYWTKCKYKLAYIIQKGCTPYTAYASVLPQLLKNEKQNTTQYVLDTALRKQTRKT
jgi:hypothetical protein